MGGVQLYLLTILLLFTLLVSGKEPETFNEILKTLEYSEKLALDITSATEGIRAGTIQTLENNGFVMTPFVVDFKGFNHLSNAFEEATEGNDLKLLTNYTSLILDISKIGNGSCSHFQLEAPFDEEEIMKQEPGITNLVFHWKIIRNISNSSEALEELISFRIHRKFLKFAIFLDEDDLIDKSYLDHPFLLLVDYVILSTELPLTYSNFFGEFRSLLNQAKPEILKVNPNCTFSLHLAFKNSRKIDSSLSEKQRNRYFHLILQSAVAWINSGEEEPIILDGFLKNDGNIKWFAQLTFQNLIGVGIMPSSIMSPNKTDVISWSQPELCRLKIVLEKCSMTFSNVIINLQKDDTSSYVHNGLISNTSNITECKLSSSGKQPKPPQKQLAVNIFVNDSEKGVSLKDYLKIYDATIKYNFVIFDFESIQHEDAIPPEIIRQQLKSQPSNTTIGCAFGYHITDLTDETKLLKDGQRKCRSLITSQTEFTLVWEVKLETSTVENAIKQMKLIQKTSFHLTKALQITKILIQNQQIKKANRHSLYCNSTSLLQNSIAEAVINFARIHELQIISRNALTSRHNPISGWWNEINVDEKLEQKAFQEPVFVARNHPEYSTIPSFPTDACIPAIDLKLEGISMDLQYSGTTLYVDDRLLESDLKTLFLFIFQKFYLIEIVPKSNADISRTLKVLSSSLVSKRSIRKQLYLQLDGSVVRTQKKLENIWEELSKLKTKMTGIHCVNFSKKGVLNALIRYIKSMEKKSRTKLGLVIEDCVAATNNDFKELSKLEIFPEVKYLLCLDGDGKGKIKATNEDKVEMEKFLDTHLFIRESHQRIFKKKPKELLFRHSPAPYYDGGNGENGTIENYLNYVADVSQYAKGYQMKFFMSPAFDNENKTRLGWWRVMNFEDLANVSAFVEKESEFREKETRYPSLVDDDDLLIQILTSLPFTIAITIVTTAIVFLLLVVLPVYIHRKKFAFLTKEEVELFIKGRRETVKHKNQVVEEEEIDNLKFPKEYEILDTNFILLNILGQGNFGVVHNAQLRLDDGRNSTVALKMPLPGCTKESFKSMLSELKVLCYVGNHPNVIQFVGAHVQEIGKGKVYIATEMCENGALISYLRNLKTEPSASNSLYEKKVKRKDSDVIVNPIVQLNRFSYEISLGMDYLGQKKIIHGDLSARNVLLDSNLSCKIGDFGLSRKLYEYQQYVKKSQEPLPWRWMALESLKKMEFTIKSDVWSYGVTMWEIYSLGAVPYPGLSWTINFVEELENGLRLTSPAKATESLYDKMIECWNPEPEERPTFAEIASFFRSLRDLEYVNFT